MCYTNIDKDVWARHPAKKAHQNKKKNNKIKLYL